MLSYYDIPSEFIIFLSNTTGSGYLIISIPISSKGGTQPAATAQLSTIIQKKKLFFFNTRTKVCLSNAQKSIFK